MSWTMRLKRQLPRDLRVRMDPFGSAARQSLFLIWSNVKGHSVIMWGRTVFEEQP